MQRRRLAPPAGVLRFSGESSDFNGRDLFAERSIENPFGALAYAKAPALVAATPTWLYGANLVGSADHATAAFGTGVNLQTIVGAFDVTKIGVFGATVVTFFLAEMGDKTQIATVALAARFHDFFGVVAGTTLGMMIANVPAIFLGNELLKRVDLKKVRMVAAALFLVIGLWVLAQAAGLIG